MSTIDFIKAGWQGSRDMTMALLDDMKDAPMTAPTPNGGNHPMWVLGHLVFAEAGLVDQVMLGNEHPLESWRELFGAAHGPVDDQSKYPSWDEVRAKADQVRARTLEVLEGLTDADLAKPSKNCPPEREQFFGTIGGCCTVLMLHPAMHRGQVADARRALGRSPLML